MRRLLRRSSSLSNVRLTLVRRVKESAAAHAFAASITPVSLDYFPFLSAATANFRSRRGRKDRGVITARRGEIRDGRFNRKLRLNPGGSRDIERECRARTNRRPGARARRALASGVFNECAV